MKRTLCILLVITMTLAVFTGCGKAAETPQQAAQSEGAAEPIVWRLTQSNDANSANSKATDYFCELVYERTNGRYRIDNYPNAVLMSASDGLEGAQLGNVEIAMINASLLTGLVPEYGVFSLPFLIESNEHADKVLLGESSDYWFKYLEDCGLVGILPFETGWRCVSNDDRDVKTVEDLAGLRIRVMEDPIMIEAWRLMGADPVVMSFNEVFASVQQGVIDGQDNPAQVSYNGKIHEVNGYFSEINYIYSWQPGVINKAAWDSLSPEDQEIFRQASEEACEYQRKLVREGTDTALKNMEDAGVSVLRVDDVDRDSFLSAIEPLLAEYQDQFGEQIDFINSCK